MPRDPDCVFCKIIAAKIPAQVVFEDDVGIAFLDINPLSEGHLLLVPREHYVALRDVPSETAARVFACVPRLGAALVQVAGVQGYNVLINDGRVAGQVVPHVHCHLIPRHPADELGYRWKAGKYPVGRDQELANAYQQALSAR